MTAQVGLQTVDGVAGWASVSREGETVRLVLPIENDGDIDTTVTRAAAATLAAALNAACVESTQSQGAKEAGSGNP